MNIIKTFLILIFYFLKDIFKTFTKLTMCDTFVIMEIIGFGLVVNALYGFYTKPNYDDLILIISVLYGTLKIKHKKDERCLK